MASRPTLVTEPPAAPSSRRPRTVAGAAVVESPSTRSVTVLCDVAAIVRWSLFGLAAVIIALATLVVAWRGGDNYPATTAIKAARSIDGGSHGKATAAAR